MIPQKARDVLVTRIGDCKDVATLCIAMLREVDVEAHYVLINTRDEGANSNILPSIAFNHCIAAVSAGDSLEYLDLTATNYPRGSVPYMDIDGFSLLIKPGETEPFPLSGDNFRHRSIERTTHVTIQPDRGISVEKHNIRTGAITAQIRSMYRFKGHDEQERYLTESIIQGFPNMTLEEFSFTGIDSLTPTLEYSYRFSAPDYISEAGNFSMFEVPWTDTPHLSRALAYETREFDFNYWISADSFLETTTVVFPDGYDLVELPASIDISCPTATYSLTYTLNDGVLTGERRFVNKKEGVNTEEYAEFKAFYNKVITSDKQQILLKRD